MKKPFQKTYQTWQTGVKTFKNHQNVPTETCKKRQILFQRFLGEHTLFLHPSPATHIHTHTNTHTHTHTHTHNTNKTHYPFFEKERMKILGGRDSSFKRIIREKVEGREKIQNL